MKLIAIVISVSIFSMLALSSHAFAAGSSSKPASDTRPGVIDYNDGVKLMQQAKYDQSRKEVCGLP